MRRRHEQTTVKQKQTHRFRTATYLILLLVVLLHEQIVRHLLLYHHVHRDFVHHHLDHQILLLRVHHLDHHLESSLYSVCIISILESDPTWSRQRKPQCIKLYLDNNDGSNNNNFFSYRSVRISQYAFLAILYKQVLEYCSLLKIQPSSSS